MEECKHIYGHEELVDDGVLVYEPFEPFPYGDRWPDIEFIFCPLCGKRLVSE